MTAHFDTSDFYLTVEDVAKRFGVSTDTIWRWKRNGDCPAAVRVGPGTTRWRVSDVIEHESKLVACFTMDLAYLRAA